MVATRGRTFKRPWRRSCHSSKLKSSSAPIGRKDSWCFHAVGSSNAPLLGSTAAEGLPRIGRTSIATRWRSCGLPQSASCSENFVIPPDVFGQTLRELTPHRPTWAIISYINASFLDDVKEFPVRFDPKVYATAKARAAKIMTSSAAADLKPEGWIAGGKECERCPFTKTCGIQRRAVPRASDASVDPQFIAEMRELAIACKAHQSNADDANGKARETQREIRERLRAKGLRKITGEDFGITWSPVKGRPGIDVDALSAA